MISWTPSCFTAGAPSLLSHATPAQLPAHTFGLQDYFYDEAFAARLREEPGRGWRPVELVDHAAAHGKPHFLRARTSREGYEPGGCPRRPTTLIAGRRSRAPVPASASGGVLKVAVLRD
jgi:hypothetical protein